MNLIQTRTYVRSLLAEDTAKFWSDPQLNTFIQRAFLTVYNIVGNQRRGYFETVANISYVAGTELYTLPGNGLVKLTLVERIDQAPFVNILPVDITEKNNYARQNGQILTPGQERYFITGNQIGITPIPDAALPNALRLWHIPTPTLPTADADLFPLELTDLHHEVIAWGALMRAVVRDKQALTQIAPLYLELKTEMKNDTTVRIAQEPPRVIDTDPYG